MKSNLKGNLCYYLLHHGVRYIFPLVLTPYLARVFGPPMFADFILWNSSVWMSSMLMEFGFFLYALNETATAASEADLSSVVSSVTSAKLMLMPVAVVCFIAAMYALGLKDRHPFTIPAGVVALVAYGGSFAWYFQGLQRGRTAVIIEAIPLFIQFGLVFTLVHGQRDYWIAISLQATAGAASLLIASTLVSRKHRIVSVNFRNGRSAVQRAWPFFVERLCYAAYSTATPLIIAVLSQPDQVAFYGLGDKVNSFLIGLSAPVSQAAMPVVAKRVAGVKKDWSLSIKLVFGTTAVVSAMAAVLILIIPYAIVRTFGTLYGAAIPIAECFCFVSILMTFELALSNYVIIPAGKAKILVRTSIAALITSLIIQAWLVPSTGAFGSVLARLAAEAAVVTILGVVAFQTVRPSTMVVDLATLKD